MKEIEAGRKAGKMEGRKERKEEGGNCRKPRKQGKKVF